MIVFQCFHFARAPACEKFKRGAALDAETSAEILVLENNHRPARPDRLLSALQREILIALEIEFEERQILDSEFVQLFNLVLISLT